MVVLIEWPAIWNFLLQLAEKVKTFSKCFIDVYIKHILCYYRKEHNVVLCLAKWFFKLINGFYVLSWMHIIQLNYLVVKEHKYYWSMLLGYSKFFSYKGVQYGREFLELFLFYSVLFDLFYGVVGYFDVNCFINSYQLGNSCSKIIGIFVENRYFFKSQCVSKVYRSRLSLYLARK